MNFYKDILRSVLFKFDAELVHDLSIFFLKNFPFERKIISSPKIIGNVVFQNPIGLAAGFDKNAVLIDAMDKLGFGFMEVGTITPLPQIGNPTPRLFRNAKDQSITNRMGFNNDGVDVISRRLEKRKSSIVVGANIGKGISTYYQEAKKDYVFLVNQLHDLVDYFTINVSSPNTPNLRELMKKDNLDGILDGVMNENRKRSKERPIFVKISPDLSDIDLINLIHLCEEYGVIGIVATNTTIVEGGGLSGLPLEKKSSEIIQKIKNNSNLVVCASGGIMNSDIVKNRIELGCDLIQVYTGLIYNGLGFIDEIGNKLTRS